MISSAGRSGILDLRHLMSAFVDHLGVGDHEAVLHRVVVEFGARVGVSHRHLNGLDVEFLGEVDGVANGFAGLAGQSQDEIAVDDQTELVAILGELAGAFDGRALFDVLEDLRIARLVADDQQPAAGFLHRLEGFVIGGDARGAGPGQAQRLQLGAQFDGARLLNVESVVVEEKFLHVRPDCFGLRHFGGDVVGGTLAPRMSAQRLRPQAERALRRTSARGVERDVGVQQERHVVARDIEVALVDFGDVGQSIQIAESAARRDCARSCRSFRYEMPGISSSGLPLA